MKQYVVPKVIRRMLRRARELAEDQTGTQRRVSLQAIHYPALEQDALQALSQHYALHRIVRDLVEITVGGDKPAPA